MVRAFSFDTSGAGKHKQIGEGELFLSMMNGKESCEIKIGDSKLLFTDINV